MRALVNGTTVGRLHFAWAKWAAYGFKVQGWVDHFETWHRDLLKRIKPRKPMRQSIT
jgi:hypothetical protein